MYYDKFNIYPIIMKIIHIIVKQTKIKCELCKFKIKLYKTIFQIYMY